MKKILVVILFAFLWLEGMTQKTYLAGVHNTPINTTCEEFHNNITHDCQYIGEYAIAHIEDSWAKYDNMAETYLAYDIWGHGRAHIYEQCVDGKVKFVYVEFPWEDASYLGSNAVATFTWGAKHIFPELYGKEGNYEHGWCDDVYIARYKTYYTWILPEGVIVTITCFYQWKQDQYNKDRIFIDLEGRIARTEIKYEVL